MRVAKGNGCLFWSLFEMEHSQNETWKFFNGAFFVMPAHSNELHSPKCVYKCTPATMDLLLSLFSLYSYISFCNSSLWFCIRFQTVDVTRTVDPIVPFWLTFFATASIGFVHVFQPWTLFEPWTLLSSFWLYRSSV